MLDHVTLGVSDLTECRAFYDPVLLALRLMRLFAEGEDFAGYGVGGRAFFWIGRTAGRITGTQVAFAAETRSMVDAFHEVALARGGRDNGKQGLRPHCHANHYAAFILAPDRHNIEAVCRAAP